MFLRQLRERQTLTSESPDPTSSAQELRVHCVHPLWLVRCWQTWQWVDETPFELCNNSSYITVKSQLAPKNIERTFDPFKLFPLDLEVASDEDLIDSITKDINSAIDDE